jgi:hypothetical protein
MGKQEIVQVLIVFRGLGELVQAAELLPQAMNDLLLGLRSKYLSLLLFLHFVRRRILCRNILEHAPHPLSLRSDNLSCDSDIPQCYVVFPIHTLSLGLPDQVHAEVCTHSEVSVEGKYLLLI